MPISDTPDRNDSDLTESPVDVGTRVVAVLVLVTGLPPDEIHATSTFDDLGLDSLDQVELVEALEEEFELTGIESEVLDECHTAGDLLQYIKRRVQA